MKRIIFGVVAAGTAALLLTGSAAQADEGRERPQAQQWQRGDDPGYGREQRREGEHRRNDEGQREGWRRAAGLREARYRRALEIRRCEEQRERRERFERERFEHLRLWNRW